MLRHKSSARIFVGFAFVLLVGECGLADATVCHTEQRVPRPGPDGFAQFGESCPSECPFATKKHDAICNALCVSECGHVDKNRAYENGTTHTCQICADGCEKCASSDRCLPGHCHKDFVFNPEDGSCVLPAELWVKSIVKWTVITIVSIILFLLLCFGGVRNAAQRVVSQAKDSLEETLLEGEHQKSHVTGESHSQREARKNLEAIWHSLKLTHLMSIRASRARRRARRSGATVETGADGQQSLRDVTKTFVHFKTWEERDWKERLSVATLWQSKSNTGIGMLLFRNSQKFYVLSCVLLLISVWTVRNLELLGFSVEVDPSADVNYCKPSNWHGHTASTKDLESASGAELQKKLDTFAHLCCEDRDMKSPVNYAEAMFWWGGIMYFIMTAITIYFAYFQMGAVEDDEEYQQARGVDEQDYTFLLKNVPQNIQSERELTRVLEEKLNLHGKLYGASIVYDVKEPEWEERIKEMLDNLVRYDLCTMEHYDAKTRGMYKKCISMEDLEEKIKKDKADFRDWLQSKGDLGGKRSGKPIASGDAYVVFKKKCDLKTFLACVQGVHLDPKEVTCADPKVYPYTISPCHIMKVCEVQWEPSDVMWMDCVPTAGMKRNALITASITMIAMLLVMFILTALVFYTAIIPYQEINVNAAESSSNFTYMNQLLALVCMLIPGMPAGLAQGIGYVRMNEMEGFIFVFIFFVFGIWNLTTITVQWGVIGLFDNPELWGDSVTSMNVHEVLREMQWAKVVPTVMFPGQMVQGYIINELLTALLPLIIPTAVSLLLYYFHVFPKCMRGLVAKAVLQFNNAAIIDAYKFENAIMLQPYRLSMEYAFMMWVPFLSMSILFFLADNSIYYVFGGLVIYSLLMFFFVHVCISTMRDTSFDSVQNFVSFLHSWGLMLATFPTLSVWWAARRDWISGRVAIIIAGLTFVCAYLLFQRLLTLMNFHKVMDQKTVSEMLDNSDGDKDCEALKLESWNQMTKHDQGFQSTLNTAGYSWWNMNPIYVLKYRYARGNEAIKGHEIMEDGVHVWPKGYLTHSLVQIGRDWRFKMGEDPDLKPNTKALQEQHENEKVKLHEIWKRSI